MGSRRCLVDQPICDSVYKKDRMNKMKLNLVNPVALLFIPFLDKQGGAS